VADDHTIYFNVNNRDTYKIVTHGACLAGLSASAQPALESKGAGGQICNQLDVDVSAHGGRCIVESLRKLSEDEVAEIPGRMNPQMLMPAFNLKPHLGGSLTR
jgi:Na+-transporting NADH:ubiquinone oxidoreductase subunit NqrF